MSLTTPARTRHLALASLLSLTLGVLATAPATADGAQDGDQTYGGSVREVPRAALTALMRQKGALEKYRDPAQAVADGYLPTTECVASPAGGMGYHYVNPTLLGSVDLAHPPVLVYVPDAGGPTLGAAEWFAVDVDQDLATDGDRPSLLGVPFDGPMPGHDASMPVHYDLHAWLFRHNPDGLLAPWNPSVRC